MNQRTEPPAALLRIALIKARWHADIGDQGHAGFADELARLTDGSASLDTDEHRRFFLEHLSEKGKETASACLSILQAREDCRSR
jgi:6,7-dimethyl-8-ribityllumazine synthase